MAEMTNERLLLTVEEAARRLGIGRSLAWRLVRRGDLPSIRLGRLVRIPGRALEDWIGQETRGDACAGEGIMKGRSISGRTADGAPR